MLPIAIATLFAVVFEQGLWPVLVTVVLLFALLLRRLQALNDWLRDPENHDLPDSVGLWGQVFDKIYKLNQAHEQDRERLQNVVDYLESSFASMADAVVMLDPMGNIEWCNSASEEILALQSSDDRGQAIVNLIRSPEFLRYFDAEEYSQPLEMHSPQNSDLQLSISISFFGRRNRLLFARDVSRTYQLEKMRKDFVANVSHELRTPLTVINGYLETFAEHGSGDPKWQRPIEQMLQQSSRMQQLIQDLMVLSRLEAMPKSTDSDRVIMRPLLESLAEEVSGAATGTRALHIECDDSFYLTGCNKELRSAFSNLVMNAARYTRDGDEITLRWYREGQNGVFEVADTGIGIEPRFIPRLTERFYRVDESRSIDTGGTGLGLAIVKHVLIRHRAELRIHSVANQGSSFACVFTHSALRQATD